MNLLIHSGTMMLRIVFSKGLSIMLAIIIAAIAPGIALLTFFYLKDRYEPEPLRMVIRLFIFGALICFPVMIIQYGLRTEISDQIFFSSFITAGFLEEFIKWFVLYYLIYNHEEFDEPYDGIVYAVAVSLGFATLENFLYLVTEGLSVAFLRAFIPVTGHALFGVVMGYYIGLGKFIHDRKKVNRILLKSLFIPVMIHGTYDLLVISSQMYWLWTVIPFMIWLWWFAMRKAHKATFHSKKVKLGKELREESSY